MKLGEVDEAFQDELYERLFEQYKQSDRGKPLRACLKNKATA